MVRVALIANGSRYEGQIWFGMISIFTESTLHLAPIGSMLLPVALIIYTDGKTCREGMAIVNVTAPKMSVA